MLGVSGLVMASTGEGKASQASASEAPKESNSGVVLIACSSLTV